MTGVSRAERETSGLLNRLQLISTGVFVVLTTSASFANDDTRYKHFTDDSGDRAPLHTVVPTYPSAARRDRVEGDVQVCFNVDRKGRPYRISVRTSTNRVFEKPAIRAVRASRYAPLPEGRELSGIKTCRTFQFRLESVARNN